MNLSGIRQNSNPNIQNTETRSAENEGVTSASARGSVGEKLSLSPGQLIRGEIVSREGSEVQIWVGDSMVNAHLDQSIAASEGQRVVFEVKSMSNNTIALRPLYENLTTDTTVGKALLAAGMEVNPETAAMVSAMMEEGMPISSQALQGMFLQISDYPQADIQSLVQMNRLDIPVTTENLSQFESYKSSKHQLLQTFEQVASEIPDAVSAVFSGSGNAQGNQFVSELLHIFSEGLQEGDGALHQPRDGKLLQETITGIPSGGKENGQTVPGNASYGSVLSQIAEGSGEREMVATLSAAAHLPERGLIEGERLVLSGEHPSLTATAGEGEDIAYTLSSATVEGESASDIAASAAGVLPEDPSATGMLAGAGMEDKPALSPPTGQVLTNLSQLSQEDMAELASLLSRAGADHPVVEALLNGSSSLAQIYQTVMELAEEAAAKKGGEDGIIRELFLSRGFQSIFKEILGQQWSLSPDALQNKEVQEMYERVNRQTRALGEALEMSGRMDTALFKSVGNIRSNVEFMNQLNQLYTYVQLPMRLKNQSANGELFVYTNKKNLAQSDGSVSAFLHLDMEHLGMVDCYVVLEHGTKLTTNFTLEDEATLSLIEANLDKLTERLAEKGYDLNTNVKTRDTEKEQESSVMEEILKTDKNISVISMHAFDMRA